MTTPLRTLISAVCLLVAAFSVFGFMASFEPGVSMGWKVGYVVLAVTSLGRGVLPWVLGRSPE